MMHYQDRIYYEVEVSKLTVEQEAEMAGTKGSLFQSAHVSPRVLAKFYADPETGEYGPEAQKLIAADKAVTWEEARAIKNSGKFKEANVGPDLSATVAPP